MIRIGDAWIRLRDISGVQRHHEDVVSVFLRSGHRVLVRGVTVDEVLQKIDEVDRAARTPVIIPTPPVHGS